MKKSICKKRFELLMLFITLILISMVMIICHINTKGDGDTKGIVEINQQDLKNIISGKETTWVYIGRPSCPDCKEFYPQLIDFVNQNKLHIYYYNTECRASKKMIVRKYYNSLGVKTVPSIIQIKDGIIDKVYDVQIEKEFNSFKDTILDYFEFEN